MGRALGAFRRDGMRRTLYRTALKALNTVATVKILRGVWVETPDAAFLKYPDRFTAGFLPESAIRRFAADPENGMSRDFVDEAVSNGDACYGIMDGPILASYGWYSTQPTRIDLPDLFIDFDKQYVYMYKGYTHPDYRGQRLHAIGMTLALREYRWKEFKGIVSYVESDNFVSLKSSFRMGYIPFGSIYLVHFFDHTFSYSTPGCKRFGFRTVRQPKTADGVFMAASHR